MKNSYLIGALAIVMAGGLTIWSCTKEESGAVSDQGLNPVKVTGTDCSNLCINPEAPVYFPLISTICDGPEATNKCTTVTVYNTMTHLIIEVVSTEQTGTVFINDVVMDEHGFPAGETHSFYFELPSGWKACDPWPFKVRIVGGGTPDEHIGTYYLIGVCPDICTPMDETAWSAGTKYVSKGNWATYTTYTAGKEATIFAGQTINVGTATFSAVSGGNVTITINLTGGWYFRNVPENVKVQGYKVSPSTTPSPGLFANKATAAGTSCTITVPAAAYYGVHLDLEKCQ